MALKDLFDMVKADRYTADGREELIKAQEAETEDKVYQIGEISQKTGLQKTANGWVKPKKGAAGKTSRASKEEAIRKDLGLTAGEDMSRFSDEQIEKMYAKTQQTPEQQKADFDKSKIGQAVNKGRQKFAAEKTRQKELASKTNAIGLPKESKPADEIDSAGNKRPSTDVAYLKGSKDPQLKADVKKAIATHHATGNNLLNVLYNKDKELYKKLDAMGTTNAEQFINQLAHDSAPRVLTGDTRIRVRKA